MGRPVAGYKAPVCILSIPAAKALAKVQAEALLAGYALKVYDCYRPQRAVEDFATWGKGLEDQSMKRWFYPDVPNQTLFKQGYISEKSGHSRGSTVDLTLVPIIVARESDQPEVARMDDCRHPQNFRFRDDSLDMGTAFDCFDPLAHTENPTISEPARANRLYLKRLMESNGFRNLPEEWWHYTLISEPFPDRYFDFEVR